MSCITQTSKSMSIIYRLTYRLNEETTRQRNEFNALPKNWIDVQPVESIEIISWQILTSVCVIAYAQNMWIAFRRRRVARPNWEKLISERLHIVALINCHFYWNFGVHSWTCFSLSEVSMEHAARGKARPGTHKWRQHLRNERKWNQIWLWMILNSHKITLFSSSSHLGWF